MGDRVDVKQHCHFPLEATKQLTCEELARDCLEQVKRGVREFTLTRPDSTIEVTHSLNECLAAAKNISDTAPVSPPSATTDEGPGLQLRLRVNEGVRFMSARWGEAETGSTSYQRLYDEERSYYGDFTEVGVLALPDPYFGFQLNLGRFWAKPVNDDVTDIHAFKLGFGFDMGSNINKPLSVRLTINAGINWLETEDSGRFPKSSDLYADVGNSFDMTSGMWIYGGIGFGFMEGAIILNAGMERMSTGQQDDHMPNHFEANSAMFGLAVDLTAAGILDWGEKRSEKAMDNLVK